MELRLQLASVLENILEELNGKRQSLSADQWQSISRFAEVCAMGEKLSKHQFSELTAIVTDLASLQKNPINQANSAAFAGAAPSKGTMGGVRGMPSEKSVRRAAKSQLIQDIRDKMHRAEDIHHAENPQDIQKDRGSLEWSMGILQIKQIASEMTLRKQFLKRVRDCHPDITGSHQAMSDLNEAWGVVRQHARNS